MKFSTLQNIGVTGASDEEKRSIIEEQQMHSDLLVADFDDTYYNLTLKTMVGVRWGVEQMNKVGTIGLCIGVVDNVYYMIQFNIEYNV